MNLMDIMLTSMIKLSSSAITIIIIFIFATYISIILIIKFYNISDTIDTYLVFKNTLTVKNITIRI